VFGAVLALSVAAEGVFKVKGYFGLDEWLIRRGLRLSPAWRWSCGGAGCVEARADYYRSGAMIDFLPPP
jgi:hypothetical protein